MDTTLDATRADEVLTELPSLVEFAEPTPEEIGPAIPELFETAITNRLKYPKITLVTRAGRIVVIKRAGQKSKYPGSVRILDEDARFLGSISVAGVLYPSSPMTPDVRELLALMESDLDRVILEFARLTGNCCFCCYRLSDARSVAHGYGPDCAQHYGLPWCAPRTTHGFFGNVWSWIYDVPAGAP